MSVDIDPPEQLEFNRPFTQQVARYLKVRNPLDQPVAYKVKTTAPRSYCVRPNSGRIEPGQEIEVQVLLQAMKVDVPADMKCKDKFLLQSTTINDAPADANLADLWAQIEKEVADGNLSKDSIQQRKIRCVWGPPVDSNGTVDMADMSAHSDTIHTPAKPNGVSLPEINTPLPPTVIAPKDPANTITSNNPVSFHTPTGPAPAAVHTPSLPTVNNPVAYNANTSVSNPSVDAQLAEAKAQIVALTKQLEVGGKSGLRQRNAQSSTPAVRPQSARDVLTTAAESGVPVKIVAYLCLAAFFIGLFVFLD